MPQEVSTEVSQVVRGPITCHAWSADGTSNARLYDVAQAVCRACGVSGRQYSKGVHQGCQWLGSGGNVGGGTREWTASVLMGRLAAC